MLDNNPLLVLAEPKTSYRPSSPQRWIEVLVDYPGEQGLLTYRLPEALTIHPGDILCVPLGAQLVGGIAVRLLASPPLDLAPERIREVEDVITSGFFPPSYWQLIEQVAQYYCTGLITVTRVALPPGLLGRSQRRIRLNPQAIPQGAEVFCSEAARQVLHQLQTQKNGDYSAQYLQRQVRGAERGIKDLIKRGWVESYLEPPKSVQPKRKMAVTLLADTGLEELNNRQREILQVLKNHGGQMWLNEFIAIGRTTSTTVKRMAEQGYVVMEEQEILRQEQGIEVARDEAKPLSPAQATALKTIAALSGFAQVLLHGVTGSGKTEVYLQAIAPLLENGQSALVLVPEIGLTPQLTDRFRARFGKRVCVYHSALSEGERYDTWRQMLAGEPQVVIGTRSAIFAPLPKLGLIVLDEEHDTSFKQAQSAPTYHARTVAKWRAELANCPLVLGSATPSLESWLAGEAESLLEKRAGKHYHLSLPERIGGRPLPEVEVVDMRLELQSGNRSILSRSLQNALFQLQQDRQQGILFISRRGHSTFVSCRSCGYVLECPHCDVSLSYHYTHQGATERLRCHYCNYSCLQPRHCPECSSPYLKFFGSGTQRLTLELQRQFPQLRCLRFDSDTTRTKGAHRKLLARFSRQEADVLVGTQMLTKGIDLAGVTLVGIVAADGLLHRSDYRAAERAFQTLTQVAGRAGRGDETGRVILQSYTPEHPVIAAVQRHDYHAFVTSELQQRAQLNYPPYGQLILLRLSALNEAEVQHAAEVIADACAKGQARVLQGGGITGTGTAEILGPAPASIARVAQRYRWQILLKFTSPVEPYLLNLEALRSLCPRSVSLSIDVDPILID